MGMFSLNYMAPNHQAKAVLAYLEMYDGVEPSWDQDAKFYQGVNLAEWHNGRERGYVVMFTNPKREQLNIAFFEHRNSDRICALAWVQNTLNPPTIETAKFGDLYKDKYDVSHSANVGEAMAMADWIYEQLCAHWVKP
jgi:hypothetical protein